jgi:histidinol-phosphate/aromatic aminotransferase/cobyric acid decarboxylase-like protein
MHKKIAVLVTYDFEDADIVKLASNENPLGCSDKVKEAVAAELAEIGRYPDGGGFILKAHSLGLAL